MKILDSFLLFAMLCALGGLGWWGGYHAPALATGLEHRLEVEAKAALRQAEFDWAAVEMDGQHALITGNAPSDAAKDEAISIVLGSNGPGGPVFGGVTAADTVFSNSSAISPFIWRATKFTDGRIVLSGYAPSEEAAQALLSAAKAISEDGADDRAEIAEGAPEGDWIGAAETGLVALSRLESGEAVLTDTRLTLNGVAMDQAVRDEVSQLVAGLAAPFEGAPTIRGAGLWRAAHTAEGLELAGNVSSEAEKREIVEIAARHFGGAIVDSMKVGTGGGDAWMEGLRLLLPHFAKFRGGDMRFEPDGEARFVINGAAPRSTLAYLQEDVARLPADYAARLNVEPYDIALDSVAGADFSGAARPACERAFAAILADRPIVFAGGSSEISRESALTLDRLMAAALRCAPTLIFEIGAHTDSIGDRDYNLSLSALRAEAVRDYMAAAGFEAERLRAVGYGPDMPIADNGTQEGRAANRRLEIKVFEEGE